MAPCRHAPLFSIPVANLGKLWKMLRDREAGVLQPVGSRRVGHKWTTTFISARFGGDTLASSTLISPGGILFRHCEMIRMDWRISSTRHRYLKKMRQTKKRRRAARGPEVRLGECAGLNWTVLGNFPHSPSVASLLGLGTCVKLSLLIWVPGPFQNPLLVFSDYVL